MTATKSCRECGAFREPNVCYGPELIEGTECERRNPIKLSEDAIRHPGYCRYWQRKRKTEWNGRRI